MQTPEGRVTEKAGMEGTVNEIRELTLRINQLQSGAELTKDELEQVLQLRQERIIKAKESDHQAVIALLQAGLNAATTYATTATAYRNSR